MEMQNNSRMRNILWNTTGTVTYYFCQWILTVLVLRLGSFVEAGYLSLAMTTSSTFSAVALFNMRNYQISDIKGEFSVNVYFGSRFLTCIAAFVLCMITAFVQNDYYQAFCIIAFMAIRIAEAFADVLHGENQKHNHYDYIGLSNSIRGIITVVIFSISLMIINDIAITIVLVAISNLAIVYFYDWNKTSTLCKIKPEIITENVFKLLKICIPIVIFSFLLSAQNMIAKNVLQNIEGTEQLGIYATIAAPTLVIQLFISVAFSPIIPELSTLYDLKKYGRFNIKMIKIYLIFVATSIIVLIGTFILGKYALVLLYGERIIEYQELLMPVVYLTLLTSSIWVLSAIVIAIRRIRELIIGMVVDFSLFFMFVERFVMTYGKNGASFSQIFSYGLFVIYLVIIIHVDIIFQNKILNK